MFGNLLPRPQVPFVVKIIPKRGQSVSRILNTSGLAVAVATSVNAFITFPGAVCYVFCSFFLTFWQDLNLRFIKSLINLPANMKGS